MNLCLAIDPISAKPTGFFLWLHSIWNTD